LPVVALAGLPLVAALLYAQFGSRDSAIFRWRAQPRVRSPRLPWTTGGAGSKRISEEPGRRPRLGGAGAGADRIGRYDDAVRAWRNSITYNGDETALHRRRSRRGLTERAAASSAEAKAEFDRALVLDPKEMKARYFVGLAAEQDGRRADAEQAWRAMLDGAPADAPGRPLVTAALARVGSVAPALSEEALAAADGMSDAARDTMVRGMIDRLAARLEQNRDDVDGWLRLVRAYMVLGDRTKAQAISAEARQALGKDQGRLQQLNDGLKGLGLDLVRHDDRDGSDASRDSLFHLSPLGKVGTRNVPGEGNRMSHLALSATHPDPLPNGKRGSIAPVAIIASELKEQP